MDDQQGFVVGVSSGGRLIEAPRDHCFVVDHGKFVVQLVATGRTGLADAFLSHFLSRYGVKINCPVLSSLGFYQPYNMCIETRAGRLLCDTKIKYLPLLIGSGEDDKPSLNPSGEKHREKPHPIAYFCSCLQSPSLKLSMSSPWLLSVAVVRSFSLKINMLTRWF